MRDALSALSACQEPYTEHSYQRHPAVEGLDVCANCGDDRQWVVCPECNGIPQMAGDGCGWDGTNYHTPPCERCGDRGEVLA